MFFVPCNVGCRSTMLWINCDALSCSVWLADLKEVRSFDAYLVNDNLIQSPVNILTSWPSKVILRKLTIEISRSSCTCSDFWRE